MATEFSCIRCGKMANLMCSRCFERYCGRDCQMSDWYTHKKVCKEMPNLIPTSIVEDFSPTTPNYGNKQTKSSQNSSEAIKLPTNQKINQANEIMNKEFKADSTAKTKMQPHQIDDKPQVKKNVEKITVVNSDSVKTQQSTAATATASMVYNQAKLEERQIGDKRSPQQSKTSDESKTIDTTKPITRMRQADESLQHSKPIFNTAVEKHQNNSKAETSKKSKAAVMMASLLKAENKPTPPKIYFFGDLKVKPLNEGKNVKLVVTDTSFIEKRILAVTIYDAEELRLMTADLEKVSDYCEAVPVNKRGYSPKDNEMCLAIFDEDQKWYRAYCINEEDTESDQYTLQFVDYGNLSQVPRGNILPITEDLMFPTYNNFCRILNEPEKVPKIKAAIEKRGCIDCNIRYVDHVDIYEIFVNNLD